MDRRRTRRRCAVKARPAVPIDRRCARYGRPVSGSNARPFEKAGRVSGAADLTASVLLLGVALVLGVAGARVIWGEAGMLTDRGSASTSGICTFESVVVVVALAVSMAIFVCATVAVALRSRRHVIASPRQPSRSGALPSCTPQLGGRRTQEPRRCVTRSPHALAYGAPGE